ncbi:MAG: hypothetical protein ABEN55_20340 [Bradymonadaceae bacterium]
MTDQNRTAAFEWHDPAETPPEDDRKVLFMTNGGFNIGRVYADDGRIISDDDWTYDIEDEVDWWASLDGLEPHETPDLSSFEDVQGTADASRLSIVQAVRTLASDILEGNVEVMAAMGVDSDGDPFVFWDLDGDGLTKLIGVLETVKHDILDRTDW